ncbi:MAG: S1 family peptidase [Shewanella sp.]|nr:S1 family peptidase [Shewanella sp.]
MKRVIIISLGILYPLLSNAFLINESIFIKNGGDLNNVKESMKYVNNELRNQSYAKDFLPVGTIDTIDAVCTATWLGNDDSGLTYILTAAHCLPYKGEETPVVNIMFTDWHGRAIAQGDGVVYVPKERINPPPGMGRTSTDIAIVKLPTRGVLTDQTNHLVEQPIINDYFIELNKKVMFVGYGWWGVGLDTSKSYLPAEGDRRVYGESVITKLVEMDHGMYAHYEPIKENTKEWALSANGDSGSAWWQEAKGHKVIVGTTRGGDNIESSATRVSKYVPWIKGIYKDVRLLTNEFYVWGSNDRKGKVGQVYQYQNPYNHDTEYFFLSHLGSDGRYWYFPIDKSDNNFWDYVGPYRWGDNDRKGRVGTFFIYDNPYNGDRELFRLINVGSDGRYGVFPTDKSNNTDWQYVNTCSDVRPC